MVVEVAERVDSTKGLIRLLQRESRDRSNKSVAEGQACLNGAGVVEKNEWKRASKRGERKKIKRWRRTSILTSVNVGDDNDDAANAVRPPLAFPLLFLPIRGRENVALVTLTSARARQELSWSIQISKFCVFGSILAESTPLRPRPASECLRFRCRRTRVTAKKSF